MERNVYGLKVYLKNQLSKFNVNIDDPFLEIRYIKRCFVDSSVQSARYFLV